MDTGAKHSNMELEKGCVYWITGLSGSGKTTLSHLLYQRLKAEKRKVLLLDGDELRWALGLTDCSYEFEERKKIALIYCRLCKMLAEQGTDVVIATISLFHDCHRWNRENQPSYYEVYLRVPKEVLASRNQKNLYSRDGQAVVGLDVQFEEPVEPDLIIDNHGGVSPEKAAQYIWEECDASR